MDALSKQRWYLVLNILLFISNLATLIAVADADSGNRDARVRACFGVGVTTATILWCFGLASAVVGVQAPVAWLRVLLRVCEPALCVALGLAIAAAALNARATGSAILLNSICLCVTAVHVSIAVLVLGSEDVDEWFGE